MPNLSKAYIQHQIAALAFFTNFGVSISMKPDLTASRKLFWLLNVMRPEPDEEKNETVKFENQASPVPYNKWGIS